MWRGSKCRRDYFTYQHTDMGYCLMFNANSTDILNVTESGEYIIWISALKFNMIWNNSKRNDNKWQYYYL